MKVELIDRKYPNKKEWEFEAKNVKAEIALPVEFSVGAEAKLSKKNEYLHLDVNGYGKVSTTLLSVGWRNNDFNLFYIPDDVNIDFRLNISATALGIKLETTPYYKRIVLIKKDNINQN